MRIDKLAVLVWLVVASSAGCGADTTTANAIRGRMAQVDQYIQAEMQREKVPGLALAIVGTDGVAAAKGYGYANVELSVPASEDTIFQTGSVGKAFTGMAAMLEVEDGMIALDDPVTKYFPDAPKSWSAIKVRNLLNHTSGIPNYYETNVLLDGKRVFDYRRDYSEQELAKTILRLQPDFSPGSKWYYSDTGYMFLGLLLDKASGRFYGDVLRDRVFKPLGMKTARGISEADIVKNRAAGYRLENGELKNQEWVSPTMNTTADGALYLSIRDYIAWDRGLRAGAILKPSSWAEIYKPAPMQNGQQYPYGMGWNLASWQGKPWYFHSGVWQGFRTCVSRYLADGLTIVVLTNLADAHPDRIIDGVADLIDPKLPKLEDERKRRKSGSLAALQFH